MSRMSDFNQSVFSQTPRDFDSHTERNPNQVRPSKPNPNRYGGAKHKNLRSHRSKRIRPSF